MSVSPSLTDSCRVIVETKHPVAIDSVDHLFPLGTMQDNYRSPAFTRKLIELYEGLKIKVLDLGCAGGGFVKEVNEYGHLGVGLEGSDYSKRNRRAEWATIPDRLFTCDCAKPFSISIEENGQVNAALFDVVTAWEFMEHIRTEDLPALFRNVATHLNPESGIFVASVHLHSCDMDDHEYHATVQPEWWWRDMFRKNGFFILDRALDYFNGDWVRGPEDGQEAFGTCHIVASLRHDSDIVRRIDREACRRFEHGRLAVTELRRVAESALSKAESLEALVLERQQGPLDFSLTQLDTLAAHVAARCQAAGWKEIALFGAGSHTATLIPILKELCGPSIGAILVSKRSTMDFHGIPVFEVGEKLPPGVKAIVPSSNRYEREMKAAAAAAYPSMPWAFLWFPEAPSSAKA